jgi:hypothetical protein
MKNQYENVDAICCVLAPQRSREVIDLVLSTFVPEHEQLDSGYASPPDDPNGSFASPDEMINYFVCNAACVQTFFWNQYENNPEGIMVGAFFTQDGCLIMSLTLPADGERENLYLTRLKAMLHSDTGVISYTNPPPFDDGADFIKRYGT